MRTIAVIPARYNSSRFRGKPLADLCGRPMLWWVYHQVRRAKGIDEVIVATDDERILDACRQYEIPCRMTAETHRTSTERLYEVARAVPAQVYVCVNGDEPLIDPALVEQVIPSTLTGFFAANLMTAVHSPVEVVDDTNIKVVVSRDGYALFMSRSPIPHPKAGMDYVFYKHLGVLAYSLEALCFFAETPKGPVEAIEDINELRFIENGRRLKMIPVEAHTLSVDTPKDLDYVRGVIRDRLEKGEIRL
ncbi:MAG: 3-deoxy-manno-octulosonate cytidylyltransferase [Clostridiales bacterium]|nr:3-deoxy-manno-octulosonate cytidylyltransferase [Clostridiales bacterium]